MPSAEASGAICVQRFDGSRNSAIHTTYRISLRSSSIREPRYPLLRVVFGLEWTARGRATKDASELVVVWGVLKKGWIQGFWPTTAPGGEPKGGARRTWRAARENPNPGADARGETQPKPENAPPRATVWLPVWIRSIQ